MEIYLLLLIPLGVWYLYQVAQNSSVSIDPIIGRWHMTGMISGWVLSKTPASQLDYNEYYDFKANGTFLKNRSTVKENATGKYIIRKLTDGTYMELIFDNKNSELHECLSENEWLKLDDDGKLNTGSLPCDGLGYQYERQD